MSTPFTITAPIIGHFDAKGTRHQNLCVEDSSGCFRAGGPGEGLRIRRAVMSEGACTEMRLSVGAVEAVRDLALTQEIQIDLPWTSYVIAPGAVYDGNRFLVLPQAYCPEPSLSRRRPASIPPILIRKFCEPNFVRRAHGFLRWRDSEPLQAKQYLLKRTQ